MRITTFRIRAGVMQGIRQEIQQGTQGMQQEIEQGIHQGIRQEIQQGTQEIHQGIEQGI